MYTIYTSDIPKIEQIIVFFYANNTAISATSTQPGLISKHLQIAAEEKIKINSEKAQSVQFKKRLHSSGEEVTMNGHPVEFY